MNSTWKYVHAIAVVYAITILFLFPKWTVDDAYITFRYADNWAKHSELTWNVGEDPVEGVTGSALPVMLGVLIRTGVDPVVGSQAIGAISFLAGGLILYLLMRKTGIREPARCIAVLLYFTAPSFYTHAYGGLETMLFSTTILVCLYLLVMCLGESRYQALHESLLCVLLLFAGMVRPEGVILAVTSVVALGFATIKHRRKPWGFFIRASLLYILPGLAYFLWRWNYYGQLLPNTFYAKSFDGVINEATLWQLREFFLTYLALPLIIIVILFVLNPVHVVECAKMKNCSISPFVTAYGAIIAFIILVTFKYLNSTLMMDFSCRFFAPFLPVLLAGFAFLLDLELSALVAVRVEKPMQFRLLRGVLIAFIAGQLFLQFYRLESNVTFAANYHQLIQDEHISAGLFVREHVPSSEWLAVVIDAGAVSFVSGLKTVDFGKLNDETLARGLSSEEQVDYFYSFDPGAAVVTCFGWDGSAYWHPASLIMNDPRFERYTLARKYRTTAALHQNYYQFVFLRKDLVEGQE